MSQRTWILFQIKIIELYCALLNFANLNWLNLAKPILILTLPT